MRLIASRSLHHVGRAGLFAASLAIACSASGQPPDAPASSRVTVNIRDHGAVGDGTSDNTQALNQAVAACAEAGGGQVVFPPGDYLSGSIRLRSHVTLVLEPGARLAGTDDLTQYSHFEPPAGSHEARFRAQWHRALILGTNVEDVAIVGGGVIDGRHVRDPQGEERQRGPHTIVLGDSHHIQIRGVQIQNAANYAIMLEGCDDVLVEDVRCTAGWDGVHARGWPDRPSRRIEIRDCQFFTGDDAIAGRYWSDTLITGCLINSSCNGVRLIGPAEDLIIHDCLFLGPGRHPHRTSGRTNMLAGINLQPGAWDSTEGRLNRVLISDITMRDVSTPLHFSLKPGNTAGSIRLERVHASGIYRAACSVESWANEPIERVALSACSFEFSGGGTAEDARLVVKAPGVDARPLPAWGLFAQNVRSLELADVHFTLAAPDARPVIIARDVAALTLDRTTWPDQPDPVVLENVPEALRDGQPVDAGK